MTVITCWMHLAFSTVAAVMQFFGSSPAMGMRPLLLELTGSGLADWWVQRLKSNGLYPQTVAIHRFQRPCSLHGRLFSVALKFFDDDNDDKTRPPRSLRLVAEGNQISLTRRRVVVFSGGTRVTRRRAGFPRPITKYLLRHL